MTTFDAYKQYLALKSHFTSTYDYFRYNGKIGGNIESFEKRKDVFQFKKLANYEGNPTGLILSNLLKNDKIWIGDLLSEQSKKIHKDWQKINQSLTYTFENDIKQLDGDFNSNFKVTDHSPPKIVKLFFQSKISLETLAILTNLVDCHPYFDRQIQDPLWDALSFKIKKYLPFIEYDKVKFKSILLTRFSL